MCFITNMKTSKHTQQDSLIRSQFEDFILDKNHPCLMAQSVFQHENFEIQSFGKLGSGDHSQELFQSLREYIDHYQFEGSDFFTFIAVFPEVKYFTEDEFEKCLWQELQKLHEADTEDWDPQVNPDPESYDFSFSVAGKAFYVVGMHPRSSRKARQSPVPALAFNLHHQFEELRKMGTYEHTRDMIRQRDKQLQGNVNPMLQDFGKNREAMQYSGRQVDETWKCPFHPSKKSSS